MRFWLIPPFRHLAPLRFLYFPDVHLYAAIHMDVWTYFYEKAAPSAVGGRGGFRAMHPLVGCVMISFGRSAQAERAAGHEEPRFNYPIA